MTFTVEGLCHAYGRRSILVQAQLRVESGEWVGIVGANGSGKSTLLSCLAGLIQPGQGRFLADGADLFRDGARRARLVGYVPQQPPLLESLSARDNLLLWYSRPALEKSLQEGVLGMLGIGAFLRQRVKKLSGGMKKRLSIACAMAHDPALLLLDEPSAFLDPVGKQDVRRYLSAYCARGGAVLLVSHDPDELKLCHRVYCLKNGVLTDYAFAGDADRLAEDLRV